MKKMVNHITKFFGREKQKEQTENEKGITSVIRILEVLYKKIDSLHVSFLNLTDEQKKYFYQLSEIIKEVKEINLTLKQINSLIKKLEEQDEIEKLIQGVFKDFNIEIKITSNPVVFDKNVENIKSKIKSKIKALDNYLRRKEEKANLKKAA